jgi:hypothetical protein
MLRTAALLVLALGFVVVLLGFGKVDPGRFLGSAPEPTGASASDTPVPPGKPPTERKVSVESDLYSFEYTYPARAAAIPALRVLLERKIAEEKAKIEAAATDSRKDAKASGYPFQPHYFDLAWRVSADLPGWLALDAAIQTYGGGAHPNHGFDSLVWDKRAGQALAPLKLFTSADALDRAVRERYCAALDRERAERREVSVEEVRRDEMWECPAVSDIVIVLEARGGEGFDHLVLLAAPYVAGPYVEGSYDAVIAVDAAVLDAVKPEYRAAFREPS